MAFVQIAAEGVRTAERYSVAGADSGVSPTILDAAALALGCVGEREIDSVVLLPVSVPNVERRSQGRKLCYNEWQALTTVISGPKPVGFSLQA